MKLSSSLAVIVGLVIALTGVAGILVPQVLVQLGWLWATPVGHYVSAALDIVAGLILLKAAPSSRSPVALSVFAAITLIAGVLTPFLGHAREVAYATWWSNQGAGILRLWAVFLIAVGILIIVSVAPRRRMLRPVPG